MPTRFSYEYVKRFIEEKGYKLLSKEYKNAKEKLKLKCPKGHVYYVSLNGFKNGNRCSHKDCLSERLSCKARNKIDDKNVKDFVESRGYTFVSTFTGDYRKKKIKAVCPEGHEVTMDYYLFKRGAECKTCAYNKRKSPLKYSYEEVYSVFKNEGYILITNEYKNAHSPLIVRCPKGHEWETTLNRFNNGNRCRTCKYDKIAEEKSHTFDFVKEYVESVGYKLLSDTYVNNTEKLTIKCDKGHKFKTSFSSIYNSGSRCPYCYGNVKYTFEEVVNKLNDEGYELLDDKYINRTTPMNVICDKGHRTQIRFGDFLRGTRCSHCSGLNKKDYNEVKHFVENIVGYKLLTPESDFLGGTKEEIRVMCNKGHTHRTTYGYLKSGRMCRYCKSSKGENIVRWVLHNSLYDTRVVHQYHKVEFKGNKYEFDFMIDYKERPIFIEYDGEQHYKEVDHWKGKEGLKERKYNDKQKELYVKHVGGELLRVPYYLTIDEICNTVRMFISKFFNLKPIDKNKLNLYAMYYTGPVYDVEEVATYYLSNTAKDTSEKFSITEQDVYNIFKAVFGKPKIDYLRRLR